ncbi:BQ5605_C024g09825 [Microbotryum silenes-dioicae]|uniref:BQ5605_C024g09825 protein n=1 Tax=Microbotryum silenes-dioicae TaxID=796604 RepID=A0A2X0MLS0_9BASI|nr:BQ5605_C024g09825 [Microbotryum silenes-dioicae]
MRRSAVRRRWAASQPELVKISEKIAKAERDGRPWWSFEFFPPRTPDGWANLYDRIERMKQLGPIFVDITWGAGGATSEATTTFVKHAHSELGLETCMHLTCTNMPVSMVDAALKDAYDSGCRNILALRGDPPRGSEEWVQTEGGFNHAIDLIRHIRKHYGDYFDIGVAGFPEGHPQAESAELEMKHFKAKIDAGANVVFTQMFYDANVFINWGRRVREAGITVPIVPGIMPIQTFASFKRRTDFAKTIVPQELWNLLEPIKDDDLKVREVGTKFVADMCRKVLTAGIGINGIHCYTMNLSRGTEMLLEEMNFVAQADIVKPLPWRVSLTQKRRTETTRPIFWSNRTRSYLSRTADWDEFPNGRWGNQASPAFGDLDSLALSLPHKAQDATTLWGEPTSFGDVAQLFARFCTGDLKALPWSDQPVARETTVISEPLKKINSAGFLTINSQPRVDGAGSSDPVHGWGPRGGYVYQKAYLEFFASSAHLEDLLKVLQRYPSMTYHAVNKAGDLQTNAAPGPNAVTWGVFPSAEVIQPTVVDGTAFLAWKDEAFELGTLWAELYSKTRQESAKVISEIFDTFYLVNLVQNDYRDVDELAIFKPFFEVIDGTKTATANGVNGSH